MDKKAPQDLENKRSLYFSMTLWAALSLIGLFLVVLYAAFGNYTEADKIAYGKLVKGDVVQENTEKKVSKQYRQGLQKNIFFNDHNQRLELQMTSTHSELALEKTGRHIEIVEYLQEVTCSLQESVYFILPDGRHALPQSDGRLLIKDTDPKDPSSWILEKTGLPKEQMILILKADQATYYYQGELFIAKNVQVLRYITPEDCLKEPCKEAKLITEGIAAKMEFSLAGKGLDLTFDDLKIKCSVKPGLR